MDWGALHLQEDSFPLTATRASGRVWADAEQVRLRLQGIFDEAAISQAKQFVLNQGPFGGGKTHAAYYFQNPDKWDNRGIGIKSVYLTMPKQGSKAEIELYRTMLDRLNRSESIKAIQAHIEQFGVDDLRAWLIQQSDSEDIAQGICGLGTSSAEMKHLYWSYFIDSCSKAELRRLGLYRNISSLDDRVNALTCFLKIFIGREPLPKTRCVIWLDEFEDIIYFSAKEYRPFVQALRDLVDRMTQLFTFVVNFTLSTPEAELDINAILGQAVVERITHRVYFRAPEVPEAVTFVRGILEANRLSDFPEHGKNPDYPFDAGAIEFSVENLPEHTPREINRRIVQLFTAWQKEIQNGATMKLLSINWIRNHDERLAEESE